MIKKLLIAFLLLAFQDMQAQEQFQPIPPEEATRYRFNLSKSFYADQTAYDKDFAEANKMAEEIEKSKGKIGASGSDLLQLIRKMERFNILTQKLYIYRYLSYATDTAKQAALSAADQAISELSAKVAFVNTELRQLTENRLDELIKQEPKLADYRFYLFQNIRYKPHTLTADEEELLSTLSPQLYSWQPQFFQKLIDRTKFTEMQTAAGTLSVYKDRQILSKDPDRNVRKSALLKLYEEYGANADLLGFILIKQADTWNATTKLRNFRDAFAASLFDAYLSKEQADQFFESIGNFAPLMRRYTQLRKDRIKAFAKLDSVEPWDRDLVPPDFERPRFTIDQTAEILKNALNFHGPAYAEDLAHLLDPVHGRLDIVKGENRVPGAFAWGYYGAPWVFYSFVYHGYLDDVLTLAHEGGHVVHFDLIQQNKTLPVYYDGPAYFTESFAMLNEFVTVEYLYNKATSTDHKVYYLEQWLDVAMRRFFDIVMRSEFEYRAYEKMLAGEITKPEQVHQLWKEEGLKYIGEDYEKHDFLKYNWSLTPHFFTSPRYYINYLVANLMAINYYQRHLNDNSFDKDYVTLMKNGFTDTPLNLLRKYLELNPFDPAAVKDSMRVFEQKMAQLEKLYREDSK